MGACNIQCICIASILKSCRLHLFGFSKPILVPVVISYCSNHSLSQFDVYCYIVIVCMMQVQCVYISVCTDRSESDGTTQSACADRAEPAPEPEQLPMSPVLAQYLEDTRKKARELREKTGQWSRRLTQVHQLTMHTAVARKDNDSPAAITSLHVSRCVCVCVCHCMSMSVCVRA